MVIGLGLAVAEMAVPWWAERGTERTPWHPGHIAERYGLFTLIVLGESVLAATIAIQTAVDTGEAFTDLATTAIGGFALVASMWWIYFDQPVDQIVARARRAFSDEHGNQSFLWGYGHYFVYAGAAATGAGIAVNVDHVTHHSTLTDLQAGAAVTVPAAIFTITVWLLHRSAKPDGPLRSYACPVAAAGVLAMSFTGEPVLGAGIVLATLVAIALKVGRPSTVTAAT